MVRKFLTITLFFVLILTGCQSSKDPVSLSGYDVIQNRNARLAIAMAFDKNFINDELFNGTAYPADYFIPKDFAYGPVGTEYEGIDFRDSAGTYLTYDVEAAKEYWALAKEELNFDTTTIEFLVYTSDTAGKTAEFIKEELETNLDGLTIEYKPIPFSEKLEMVDRHEFQLHWTGWRPDYADPITMLDLFVTGSSYNETGWSNKEYNQLVYTNSSASERWEALMKAEELLLSEAVIVPLYQRSYYYLQSPRISYWSQHQTGIGESYQYVQTDDGQLNLLETNDIPSLDTNASSSTISNKVLGNVTEGLYKLSINDMPTLGTIDGIKNENDLVFTFKLNDSKWINHKGEVVADVTAYDYEYSWNRLSDYEASDLLYKTARVESFKAIDAQTFEVTVSEYVPYFEQILTFPALAPVNQEFVESVENYGGSVDQMLFNGPFYLSSWTIGEGHTFKRNPHYNYESDGNIEQVNVRTVLDADDQTVVNLYFDGLIDRARLNGEAIIQHKNRDDVVYQKSSLMAYITFNLNEKPLE